MKKLLVFVFLLISIGAFSQLDTINIGTTANDGTGESLRSSMLKTNRAIIAHPMYSGVFTIPLSFKLETVTVTTNGLELNLLDGLLSTAAELNYLVGATGATGTGAMVFGTSPTIGGTITMDNGATITNTDASTLTITEANVNIAGNLGRTDARVTQGFFGDIESSNVSTVGGVSLSTLFIPSLNASLTGTTNIAKLQVGDAASPFAALFDSIRIYNGQVYFFIGTDTAILGKLEAEGAPIGNVVPLQNDSTQMGVSTGFATPYQMYLANLAITEQSTLITELQNALVSLGVDDYVPPHFVSAEIGSLGSTFASVKHDDNLHQDSIPPVSSVTFKENGVTYGITALTIGHDSLIIELDSAGLRGATFLFSYTVPTGSNEKALQDSATIGNKVTAQSNKAVTDNLTAGFPLILSGTVSGTESINAYSHPITMPSGTQPGELILVLYTQDDDDSLSINIAASGSNWHIEAEDSVYTHVRGAVIWKIAEGGDVLLIDSHLTGLEQASFMSFRISDFNTANPLTVTSAYAISTYSDPPSNTGEYGAKNYLWIVSSHQQGQIVATVAPADFSDLLTQLGGGVSSVSISTANREYNTAAAYDPGAFTTAYASWVCFTIIVNPIP
ncbi:MAG TPA: hypothetical protein VMV77_04825 [Bacteroidales bacterium]|nr:hypothetical protein [Bacteroidales bacterium]